jgi:hypothetical protein
VQKFKKKLRRQRVNILSLSQSFFFVLILYVLVVKRPFSVGTAPAVELSKQISKTKFPIPYGQLYTHSVSPHHKQLIPEQNSGEYNPMYQLVYDRHVMPHHTKPPDLHPHHKPNKPLEPQLVTSQQLQLHATHTHKKTPKLHKNT